MFNNEILPNTFSGEEQLFSDNQLIFDFDEIKPVVSLLIGPKGLNLALMKQSGLPIPPGFCLTTNAYDMYIYFDGERDQNGLPPLLSKQIIEKYQQMDLGKVAVRSAATVEDLPKASSAGVYGTEINQQTTEEILLSVKKCFDSLNNPEAVQYRKIMGIDKEAKMSVVIQQMVQADTAGVLFTRHPITGERNKILINSIFGLGELLVNGALVGDNFTVDIQTGGITTCLESKNIMLTEKGIVKIDQEKALAPSLNEQQIRDLVYFGKTIEQLFDSPQDIEFVIAKSGKMHIVQSRPIPPMEIKFSQEELEEQQYLEQERARVTNRIADLRSRGKISYSPVVFSDSNISELIPTPTPMAFSVFTYIFSNEGGIQIGRRDMGYQLEDETSEGMFELIAGHPYFNLEIDAKTFNVGFPQDIDGYIKAIVNKPKLASYPELGLYQQNLTQEEAIARFGPELGQQYFQKYQDFSDKINFYRESYLKSFYSEIEPALNTFVERKQLIDYQSLTDQSLANECFQLIEHMRMVSCVNFVIVARLGFFATERLKHHLENIFTPDTATTLLNDLLGGLTGSKITEERIASIQVANGQISREEYMQKFGHLAVNELEISLPRKRELNSQFDSQSKNPEDELKEQRLRRQDAENYLRQEVDKINESDLVNKIFQDLLCAQTYLPLRETVKFHFTREYDLLRKALLTIQTRTGLADDDIFYLHQDEISTLLSDPGSLMPKIDKRKKERVLSKKLDATNKIPPVLFEDDMGALGRQIILEGQNGLIGMVVSKGKQSVAGVAKIIDTQNFDLDKILKEMTKIDHTIIIIESANLGMDSIISRSAGLIMETGGILAHGACRAREYGIPAVVLKGIKTVLKDGDLIEIEPNGKITIIKKFEIKDIIE